MKKRWLSLILTFAIMMPFMPIIAHAEIIDSGNCGVNGDNLTWTLDSNGTLTISGQGAMKDYNNLSLYLLGKSSKNQLAPWIFNYYSDITAVIIENGVTGIGINAFAECKNLASVQMAKTIDSIGSGAFWKCSLTHIEIPYGVTTIESGTFYGCRKLESVQLPNGIRSIGQNAFAFQSFSPTRCCR